MGAAGRAWLTLARAVLSTYIVATVWFVMARVL